MQKIDLYDEDDVQKLVESEGWGQPLQPVKRLAGLSCWHQMAFWALRVYVAAMLFVVAYAFGAGMR